MTWTKLSDDFSDDCWTLSDAAFRLHVEALVWSNRKLLDCRIPKADVRRFAKNPAGVDELVACGWWTEDEDAYVIRHHAGNQRLREAVLRQQEINKKNRAMGKARPTKGPGNPREVVPPVPSDDSSSEPTDEMDWAGLDWAGDEERNQQEELGPHEIDEATGEVLPLVPDVDPWSPGAAKTNTACLTCGDFLGRDREGMTVCGPCVRGDRRAS